MPLLTDAQIHEQLRSLDGWTQEGNTIAKNYAFPSFLKAIAFINAIAVHAEAADHHPDIHNVYNRVTISLSTHDAGGITEKDTALATQIEQEAANVS